MEARSDRRLVKLVRDDVERFCGGDMAVRYESIPHEEFVHELRKKLAEEVAEYLLDPSAEELGDVWEVVVALANYSHSGIAALQRGAQAKADYKGSFGAGLGMYLHVAEEHR